MVRKRRWSWLLTSCEAKNETELFNSSATDWKGKALQRSLAVRRARAFPTRGGVVSKIREMTLLESSCHLCRNCVLVSWFSKTLRDCSLLGAAASSAT